MSSNKTLPLMCPTEPRPRAKFRLPRARRAAPWIGQSGQARKRSTPSLDEVETELERLLQENQELRAELAERLGGGTPAVPALSSALTEPDPERMAAEMVGGELELPALRGPRASVATPLFLDSRAPPRPLPPRPGTPNVASQVWLTLAPTCRAWAARFA
jgi:hypothetical protein